MAVIVLKNADFSANNIGTIDLRVDFSSLTKSMLTRYGITIDEDDDFQRAFNKFVNNLADAGLLGESGKIKSLCLPFLANIAQSGNLSYAQMNAIDGTNFFAEDISGKLQLVSNGLKPVANASLVHANILSKYPTAVGYHCGAYNITPESKELSSVNKVLFGPTMRVIWLAKYSPAGVDLMIYSSGGNRLVGDSNYRSASCLVLGNIDATRSTLVVNGQIVSKDSPTFDSGNVKNPSVFQYENSQLTTYVTTETEGAYTASNASWSLLTIGDVLSDSESVLYNNEVNKLMQAVNLYL